MAPWVQFLILKKDVSQCYHVAHWYVLKGFNHATAVTPGLEMWFTFLIQSQMAQLLKGLDRMSDSQEYESK